MAIIFKQTSPTIKQANGNLVVSGILFDDTIPSGAGSSASPFAETAIGYNLDPASLQDWAIKRFAVEMAAVTGQVALDAKVNVAVSCAQSPSATKAAALTAAQLAYFRARRHRETTQANDPTEIAALAALENAEK